MSAAEHWKARADAAEALAAQMREALAEIDYIANARRIGGPTMDGKQQYSSPYFGQIVKIARAALAAAPPAETDG